MRGARDRYGPYQGGEDPLASPFDAAGALDALGDRVLAGEGAETSLRELLRHGLTGRQGLDELARQARKRQQQLRDRGRLDGTLSDIEGLLEDALEAERQALFPDPSDDARFRETQLDALPREVSRAVRELSEYQWRSRDAQEFYEQIRELLNKEVLSQQFAGIKAQLDASRDPQVNEELRAQLGEMLADLNALLDSRAHGTDTQQDFDEFMRKHGELFPDNPQTLDELLEELARRANATDRLMRSLPSSQREELMDLMQQSMQSLGLDSQLGKLNDSLRALRPDLFRPGREDMTGETPLGLGEATSVLAEIADLDALSEQLGQSYAGATVEDIDEDLVQRALGRQAVDDLAQLRRVERELEAQGYLVRRHGESELTAKAVRRLGMTALRRVFDQLSAGRQGGHDVHQAGASGEVIGSTRAWEFGDEQPLDVVRTLANAVRRGTGPNLQLVVDDFEVAETEQRSAAAVCLLVDASYSMVVNDTWGEAKQTALALHSLISTMYPQDSLQIVAFSEYAREIHPMELAGLDVPMVQGTNLQHALLLAGRFVDRHPAHDPVILVITDGEPTARLDRDGTAWFAWPPEPETLAVTVAEVDKMTRRKAVLNVFMLGDDPRLRDFVDDVTERNGGRVFTPGRQHLGEYVVSDFLSRRKALRPR